MDKLTKLQDLPEKERLKYYMRYKAGTMTLSRTSEGYLAISENDLNNYKSKKMGRPIKNFKD